jgi:hypothetical protein
MHEIYFKIVLWFKQLFTMIHTAIPKVLVERMCVFNWLSKIVAFYVEGFKSMRLGKKLWAIVFIKLFVLFAIVKVLFFPNLLKENFRNDEERSGYILDQLTHTDISIPNKGEKNGTH